MKKILFVLLVSVALLLSFSCATTSTAGTGDSTESSKSSSKKKATASGGGSFSDVPDWYGVLGAITSEYGEDIMVGFGEGKKINASQSRSSAVAQARGEIAEEMGIAVSTMYKEFLETKGYDPDRTLEKTSTVRKTIASQNIVGSKLVKQYKAADGTYYVVYIVEQQAALRNSLDASRDAVRADELYADFQSEKAFDELDEELTKLKQESVR